MGVCKTDIESKPMNELDLPSKVTLLRWDHARTDLYCEHSWVLLQPVLDDNIIEHLKERHSWLSHIFRSEYYFGRNKNPISRFRVLLCLANGNCWEIFDALLRRRKSRYSDQNFFPQSGRPPELIPLYDFRYFARGPRYLGDNFLGVPKFPEPLELRGPYWHDHLGLMV